MFTYEWTINQLGVQDSKRSHPVSQDLKRVHSVTEPPLGGSRDLGAFFATLPEKLFSDPLFCSIFLTFGLYWEEPYFFHSCVDY